jgi:hypothetical protein
VDSDEARKATSLIPSSWVLYPWSGYQLGTCSEYSVSVPTPLSVNDVGLSANGIRGPRLDPTTQRVPDPSL